MRKLLFNLSAIIALLIGLVATVPVAPALADCVDGDDDPNTIVCDADPGPENSDTQLDGGFGDDTLVVEEGVTVEWVEGDGADDDRGGDFAGEGDGDDDTIIMNGTTEGISGDYVDGNGGDDTIIVGAAGFVDGDKGGGVVGDDASGDGGNDTIIIDGIVIGEVAGDYAGGTGGDDTIEVNGLVFGFIAGDDTGDAGGDDTITINGGLFGDVVGDYSEYQGGNDTIIIGSTGGVFGSVIGDDVGGGECAQACVIASGDGGDDVIIVDGIVFGDVVGDYVAGAGGNDTITVNGYVGGSIYGDEAYWFDGNDTITINGDVNGDVIADTYSTIGLQGPGINCVDVCGGPDDTVIIGAGSVSYSTACGDISVTNANIRQGTVGGLIDGDAFYDYGSNDSLVFNIVTNSQAEVDSLNAYLYSLDPYEDTASVNGETYNFWNFESLRVQAIMYTDGPARVYDDGMTLAFSTAGGVAVCHGPSGLRAATIDFANVSEGQMQFGDNGFVVTLTPNGSGLYEAHVFKDGVEQINDANNDGVADSTFMFGLG
jgi:hypothetical protein